ncbi:hypothetical protein CLAFUW4_02427 [Fulvia fulva]|uniref:Uncharacterized protein n=1 Tax=Passalora fulva TaxID=5499 RepID=A0A9Q8LA04_PASFU|nr:uncharacterized protein CLAFUR5_02417 [Fulvia fulva]KAK4631362.1 hypothetical protein CLAFUR4_02422 [Fulvia fulva]KAK4634007.1 hypothetical protein CLAFUR0_02426 [Fulvia fulva]UJO13540.1 hypothetical protein CLAFUR5_02417 [Fulvia fulva]WPV11610.1 hypothetical protein CLAFUW4_02427 [Fulvia fulva]WPV26475.1 hypothetical protein CLAFUW7_02427 [Fulvia fulva]
MSSDTTETYRKAEAIRRAPYQNSHHRGHGTWFPGSASVARPSNTSRTRANTMPASQASHPSLSTGTRLATDTRSLEAARALIVTFRLSPATLAAIAQQSGEAPASAQASSPSPSTA